MDMHDWLAYFLQNQLDRRGIAWHEGIHLGPRLHEPVQRSLAWLCCAAERSAHRLENVAVRESAARRSTLEHLAAEKREAARLMRQACDILAGRCSGACAKRPASWEMERPALRRSAATLEESRTGEAPAEPRCRCAGARLAGKLALQMSFARAAVVATQLVYDAFLLKLFGEIHAGTDDIVLKTVCDQLLHDTKFHLRFYCDQLRQSLANRSVCRLVLTLSFILICGLFTRRHRKTLAALGVPRSEFLRGAHANFAAAVDAIFRGIPFARDAADQVNTSGARGVAAAPGQLLQPRDMRLPPRLDPNSCPPRIEPRRALLINPFYPKDPHASFGKHVLTPTLALTSVAGATPSGWDVSYWDENLLQGPPPCAPFPQVVGITVHLTFAERAFALAGWYRERGAVVVLGGLHTLSCPDECAPHADALAIGDGVQLWPQILSDVEANTLRRVYQADYRRPYRDDPPPRRALVPRRGFLTSTSLIATRGCHNRCGFCYLSTEGLHMPYLMHDPDQIVQEFAEDGQPYGVFVDNNLGSRPEYLRRLCRALRPLEKIWSAAVTIDITDDPSLVREMALAGCTGVFIGFESLSDENLIDAHKKTTRTEDYARRVRILHDNGIQVNGSFVLGFDHDRRGVFERTVRWIEANRLECATFHILTPYPGTPLFKQMEAQGRLLHRNWNLYDTAHVVFRPQHMAAEELADGYAWCYERLFSHRSIWTRRPADASTVLPYLAMSYLYKRSNRFWHLLIRHRLQHTVWHPLVEYTRRRHVRFRSRLAVTNTEQTRLRQPQVVVSAGV